MAAVSYTAEQRRAVYADDCARLGHILTLDRCIQHDAAKPLTVEGPDGKLPYLRCQRCTLVWLVDPTAYEDYDSAEKARNQQVKPEYRFVRVAVNLTPDAIKSGLSGLL